MENTQTAVLKTTIELELPAEINELLNCVTFWNQDGPKCYKMNCPEERGRKIHTYESWILDCMVADCKSIILGRSEPLDYKFGKAGSHVWVSKPNNNRILMFHF